jgi:uncharacterized membrane protein
MALWNRKTILTNAVSDWHTRGLLDETTAANLLADTDTQGSSFSFQNILILLAVICLGFAAMTFVAAKWDDMARLTRVAVVLGSMWVFWGASAFFQWRDQTWFAQVFTLGACAMFGAGIMLISQIYHIQGSAKDATWLWALGTILAATFTRSIPALALSIALFTTWSWLEPSMFSWRNPEFQYSFIAYMAVCAALAYWMHSRFCAHLVVLATALWAVPTGIALLDDGFAAFPSAVIGITFVLMSIMLFSDRNTNWLRGFERAVVFFAIGVLGVMCFFWSVEMSNGSKVNAVATPLFITAALAILGTAAFAFLVRARAHPNSYDIIVTAIFTALTFTCMALGNGEPLFFMALLLAASIWIIRMGWRIEYRPITVLGFISFGLMMLWIYFETIGTLLGTSVFYAVAGVLLLAGVFIIPRLTRTPVKGEVK